VSYENAIYQWRQGEQRVASQPVERASRVEQVVQALVNELRRRLGGRFLIDELVELYATDTQWCLVVAMRTAPDQTWAWEARTVVDAAFGRYVREAADYAGGRRERTASS
jgi:hypothetical protein